MGWTLVAARIVNDEVGTEAGLGDWRRLVEVTSGTLRSTWVNLGIRSQDGARGARRT